MPDMGWFGGCMSDTRTVPSLVDKKKSDREPSPVWYRFDICSNKEKQVEQVERIGIFDSGLGGLTVLNRCMELMPEEAFLYYADTDNVPYGDKTREQIIEYVDNAVDYMLDNSCKAIVIACNSATSAGVDYLRDKYKNEIIVSIEPAVKPAVLEYARGGKVLVLATRVTIEGRKLDDLIKTYDKDNIVVKQAMPELAMLAENGTFDTDVIVPHLKGELDGLDLKEFDVVVLGCTHFPFFYDSFKILMPWADVIDGSEGVARQVGRELERMKIRSQRLQVSEHNRVVYVDSGRDIDSIKRAKYIRSLNERLERLFGVTV